MNNSTPTALIILIMGIFTGCEATPYTVETCTAEQGVSLPDDAPYLGDREAPVWVSLFGDVKCPYTARMTLSLAAFIESLEGTKQEGAVRVSFYHFPILNSEELARTAEAAHLDGNQSFWDMYWCLVTATGGDSDRVSYCAEWLELDEDELRAAASSDAVRRRIYRDEAAARRIGFGGAPGMLLCGYWMPPDPGRVIDNLEELIAE